jgi:peptidyl-prolyl cis-trans isomerase D
MLKWKDKVISLEDKKKVFKNSGAYLLLGLSVIAMTFFGICSPQDGGVSVSGNAAKVGGEKVTLQEFQREYTRMRDRMQQQYQDAFDPVAMQLPKYVMRQIVDERIAFQAARLAGIEAQEDDVVKLLKEAKAFQDENGAFSADAYRRYLRGNGYSEASFSSEIRRNLTVQNFRKFISNSTYVSKRTAALHYRLNETKVNLDYIKLDPQMLKTQISEDDVKAFLNEAGLARVKKYFDEHPSEFNTKEKIKARHILLSYTGARNASGAGALRTKDDAKKKAQEVLAQVQTAGADFSKLASTWTDEASGKTKGGDLGMFGREDMVKEFSDAAFALSPGQLSGVVESPFGFHIIKVEDKQEAKTVTLEAATDGIARKIIKEEKTPSVLQEKAKQLLAELKVGKNVDSVLSELGAKWESTGPLAVGSSSFGALGSARATMDAIQKLAKPGDIADSVVESGAARFVVRLKSKDIADETKLDALKHKELVDSAVSSSGYALQTSYERVLRKDLEAKGKIWENPEFLTLGQRSETEGEGSGG